MPILDSKGHACLLICLFLYLCGGGEIEISYEVFFSLKFRLKFCLSLPKSYTYPSAPPRLVSPPAEPYLIKQKCQEK